MGYIKSRAGGLQQYTGFAGMLNRQYSIPVQFSIPICSDITLKHIGKSPSNFPEGKNSLTCQTHMKSSLPQSQITTGNQICGNTSINVSKRQVAALMLMLLQVNSAIPLLSLREKPQHVTEHEVLLSLIIISCLFFVFF